MTADEMWIESGLTGKYTAWSFGDDADKLAELVRGGKKTATCSALDFYVIENEKIPQVGEYNIILDSKGDAVCITETKRVYVTSFGAVSKEHAFKEGEGDRTLEHWRKTHKKFFTEELKTISRLFNENIELVCEEFEVVWQP